MPITPDTSLFRSGFYNCTYNAVDLGDTTDGYKISITQHNELISVDRLGETVVDGINRGRTTRIRFVLTNPSEAARKLITYPYDDTSTALGTVTRIGQTLQFLSYQMILTPLANINSNNKTLTIPKAAIDQDNGGFTFNTRSRQFECNLIALVNLSTGIEFTET